MLHSAPKSHSCIVRTRIPLVLHAMNHLRLLQHVRLFAQNRQQAVWCTHPSRLQLLSRHPDAVPALNPTTVNAGSTLPCHLSVCSRRCCSAGDLSEWILQLEKLVIVLRAEHVEVWPTCQLTVDRFKLAGRRNFTSSVIVQIIFVTHLAYFCG